MDQMLLQLTAEVRALRARLNGFIAAAARAEVAGGVSRLTFADLPPAGQKGRLYYVLDGRKAGEGVGAGTGVLAQDDEIGGVPTWVRVDDPSQAVQV